MTIETTFDEVVHTLKPLVDLYKDLVTEGIPLKRKDLPTGQFRIFYPNDKSKTIVLRRFVSSSLPVALKAVHSVVVGYISRQNANEITMLTLENYLDHPDQKLISNWCEIDFEDGKKMVFHVMLEKFDDTDDVLMEIALGIQEGMIAMSNIYTPLVHGAVPPPPEAA